jgi:hypothetical protein
VTKKKSSESCVSQVSMVSETSVQDSAMSANGRLKRKVQSQNLDALINEDCEESSYQISDSVVNNVRDAR